ncbi:MAG: transglutaminase domain-containing protein [Dehalococcoidia bacterium]|nr:transglutaminase domain-containing protein [Dehalococcoidia bacterium]
MVIGDNYRWRSGMAQKRGPGKNRVKNASPAVRIFCTCFPLLVALWILLVLYPNPLKLAVSVERLASPKADPRSVETLAENLPSEPAVIEEEVLKSIPYQYDWEAYGMPWYYPTVDEVLERGSGDCKARAIVLASILEAKGIPYQIKSSPMHVWVDYEGKAEDELENPEAELYNIDPQTGQRSLRLPGIDVSEFASTVWQGFWPPMPIVRKLLLVGGLVILGALRVLWPRRAVAVKGRLPNVQDARHISPTCGESRST